ncbi:MAG: sel1 repeat family protein [Candidatus Methanomethylophilaceae archaeon]|nr:sel1 repeat family protein [Candidatus Methanomethylophilaceae archaeon]
MMDRPSRSSSSDPEARRLFQLALDSIEVDQESAKDALRKASAIGCTDSMVLLGDILIDGTEDDKKEALGLFTKAYEAGNSMGSRNLGYCHALGLGTPKDKAEGARWYTISALSGNAKAQCNIGVMCEFGNGVPEDCAKAAEWYRMSAENGYSRGMTNYACLLRDGRGVPRDPEAAAMWFERSGSPRSKRLLALMLLAGDGIPKDEKKATALLEEAAVKDRKAAEILASLKS